MNIDLLIAVEDDVQRQVYLDILGEIRETQGFEISAYLTQDEFLGALESSIAKGHDCPICMIDLTSPHITLELVQKIHRHTPRTLIAAFAESHQTVLPDHELPHLFKILRPVNPTMLRAFIQGLLRHWNNDNELRFEAKKLKEAALTGQHREAITKDIEDSEWILQQARQSFLATVTHQIQTPLNGILGMAKLLVDTQLDEEQKEYVNGIEHSSHQLMGAMVDLVDYSRSQIGALHLDPQTLNICELMDSVLETAHPSAREKHLELHLLIPKDLTDLWEGDARRLRQMLVNLINFSVQKTTKGEIAFGVQQGQSHGRLRFWVKDSSEGIDANLLAQLFQAKYNFTNEALNAKSELGLTVCATLVREMGGEVGADCMPGKGCRYWFEVPMASHGISQRPKVVHDAILVAIKHPLDREALCSHLERLGFSAEGTSVVEELDEILISSLDAFNGLVLDEEFYTLISEEARETLQNALPPLSALFTLETSQGTEKTPFKWKIERPATYRSMRLLYGGQQNNRIGTVDRSNVRILLVEDHAINRKVAIKMLERVGYRPENLIGATDGEDALNQLTQHSFDLVLMDCQMPGMDGFECTRSIRRGERGVPKDIPVIALTAFTSNEDRKNCTEAGMSAFIPKPIQADRLDDTILKILQYHRAVTAKPDAHTPS
jgi:two-component system sensor histidine kinase/response regulator